jgi:hypothetical protein
VHRRATTPAAANEFLKSMRAVLDYLVSVDEIEANPAKLVKYNAIKTDGFHIWMIEEVARFVERHGLGSKAVRALALLLFTGQRRGDVIKMGLSAFAMDRCACAAARTARADPFQGCRRSKR